MTTTGNETGKATAERWRVGYNHDQIVAEDGTVLALVSRTGICGSMTKADQARANLVVKCVNAHDRLVEALDDTTSAMDGLAKLLRDRGEVCYDYITAMAAASDASMKARAALDAAK